MLTVGIRRLLVIDTTPIFYPPLARRFAEQGKFTLHVGTKKRPPNCWTNADTSSILNFTADEQRRSVLARERCPKTIDRVTLRHYNETLSESTARGSDKSVSATDSNPSISGEYTTQRDGGIRYAYHGSWWTEDDFVVWRVQVWQEGVVKGEPDGRILSPPKIHIRAVVTAMIEQSIENGVAIGP